MEQTVHLNFTEKNYSSLLMITGAAIALLMFTWSYNSSQQLLRQQAPLIDTIMQLRVDLSKIHQLIHENDEDLHGTIDKEDFMASLSRIKDGMNSLYHGNVQMGEVIGSISDITALQEPLNELKENIHELSTYLDKNYIELAQTAEEDLTHDSYFLYTETLVKQLDDQVHESVAKALERQTIIFEILLSIGIFFIGLLLYMLKRSDQKKAIAIEKFMRLSQALEHSGEAVIIANADGFIEFVNDAFCRMTGYSIEETLGNSPSMLSSGKQNRPFYENLWATIASGKVWRGELTNRKKDGTLYPALMTIAPILNSDGQLTHYIANQRDISEHKALEERIFQAQKRGEGVLNFV